MLKLSTRGEYGVRAMIELGLSGDDSVTVQEISNRQAISAKYLEHLLALLKKAELVLSERGPRGGYRLARPSDEINLAEILFALEGNGAVVNCLREHADQAQMCIWQEKCALQTVWLDIHEDIKQLLMSITLQEIVEKQRDIQDNTMYHI